MTKPSGRILIVSRLTGWVIGLALLAAVVLAVNQENWSDEANLGKDVFRLTYQFVLLVVIGGAVSMLYKEFSSEHEAHRAAREKQHAAAQSRRDAWRAVGADLIEIYNKSKSVRRRLRARARKKPIDEPGSDGGMRLSVSTYDKLMQELNDVQLSFETQKKLAEVDGSLPVVVEQLASIEEYLNRIIQEYEKKLPTLSDNDVVEVASLERLDEYVGRYGDAHTFREEFKEPFQTILTSVRQAQLKDEVLCTRKSPG